MNYRHSFHAGNFADVFKHVVLISLTQAMQRKENGFCYLDTHAGAGLYDLTSRDALASKEHIGGINKILDAPNAPALVQTYLYLIRELNTDAKVNIYPGSPMIVKQMMRPQDRMVLSEIADKVLTELKLNFRHDASVAIHELNGYQALKAFLPPKERRGLILIDPPFEDPQEFTKLNSALFAAMQRFATGVYAIWYPIKTRNTIDRWLHKVKENIKQPMLQAELLLYPDDVQLQLNGCGLLIINPPFQLDKTLQNTLPWLWKTLTPHKLGRYTIKHLSE